MFTRAIVRKPCPSMVDGLRTARLGEPDFELAGLQHEAYIKALLSCDLDVTVMEADNNYPDSVFIEDTALLTPPCAIIMNPGAESRKGEIEAVTPVVRRFYDAVECIEPPGTAEGGDIMMVGRHFYIGLSSRTNRQGAEQVIRILKRHGLSGSMVTMKEMLHLKTGVAYLENNLLIATGEFLDADEFRQFSILEVGKPEAYAANCIWVNNRVIMPAGYPIIKSRIAQAGYTVIEVDTSEFRKLDGGVSCLSLRF